MRYAAEFAGLALLALLIVQIQCRFSLDGTISILHAAPIFLPWIAVLLFRWRSLAPTLLGTVASGWFLGLETNLLVGATSAMLIQMAALALFIQLFLAPSQKRKAQQLRESEVRLRNMIAAARMITIEWDHATGHYRQPREFADWLEQDPAAPFHSHAETIEIVHPDDRAALGANIRASIEEKKSCESLFRVRTRHGTWKWVLSRCQCQIDEHGNSTGWTATVLVDVTDRYRNHDRLRLLESAVVHARDAIVILEEKPNAANGRSVLYANDAFCRMTGYTAEEVQGRSLHFLRGPDSDGPTLNRLRDALDTGRAFQCELLNYRKNGSDYWVELSVVPVPDPSGSCAHWVMIQRDISDRKQTEFELRRSQAMLSEAQRIAHVGSWEHDVADGSWFWSDELYRICGLEPSGFQLSLEAFRELVHAEDRERLNREFRDVVPLPSGVSRQIEYRLVRPNGEVRDVLDQYYAEGDSEGRAIRIRGVTHDITDRRQAQAQLIQAQKMELIGQMAGGIAHDFNNMLTGLLGNLELIRVAPDDPNRKLLDTVQRAAQRATRMSKNLLGLARKSDLRRTPLEFGPVVAEVIELVVRTSDPRIELRSNVRSTAFVEADRTFLNQVLLNLCLNARDAMPTGGRLSIEVDEIEFSEASPPARPGEFLRVRVEDTGHGMTPEVKARIFEPFFTTKAIDKGTGLGLAMVLGIIQQHLGWVECQSEVGIGTRFDIFLPRYRPELDPNFAQVTEPKFDSKLIANTPPPQSKLIRTILLVDDEPMIRDLGKTVLGTCGYTVLEAEDGEEALIVYRKHLGEIDLVILDLTMPKLSGRDTFRGLVEIDAHARVMFSSGYSADDMSDTEGIIGMLPKPYRPVELIAAVSRAFRGLEV